MRTRYRVLGFLFLLSIITYLDRVCISVAGKTMQDDLGITPDKWGWVLGAFTIAYACFEIPTGALADRLGPRRVLTRIVVWWSAFTSITGAITSYTQLLLARFLFGAGEAGAFPSISCAISRWFPAHERGRAQGAAWMASRIGGALSPLLVVPILRNYGWRACFGIFGGIGLLWAVAWYVWFRDHPAEKRGVSAAELAEIGGGAPCGHRGLPWRQVLAQPGLWWLMLMYHCYCWGSNFYMSWLHTFLENGRGYSKADLVRFSWLPFVFGACANLAGGATSDFLVKRVGLKWGRRLVGLSGLGLSAVFIAATLFTQDKILSVVFLALGFAGSDFMMPTAWAVCLDIGGRNAGAVGGAMNTAGQVGSFLTAVVFGYLVKEFNSYDAPLIVMAGMTVLAALAWFKIDPTKPLATASSV
jgi:ACS family glucarate transporter-like MFS transporter